jgi:hypothetical protein
MSEKKYQKIKVPEGMLDAAKKELSDVGFRKDVICYDTKRMLESALKWLSENPIVPTAEQVIECAKLADKHVDVIYDSHGHKKNFAMEWQRRMFLAVDTDVPIIDLIYHRPSGIPVVLDDSSVSVSDDVNSRIREAYRRGQKAGS